MKNSPKESIIESIAEDALDCIQQVANDAERAIRHHSRAHAGNLATVNTFNDIKQVSQLGAISDAEREALYELLRQPVIARVAYTDEEGRDGTLFVTRGTPRPVAGFKIASYRSKLGGVASRDVGEEVSIPDGGVAHEVEINNVARLKPRKGDGGWDSLDSEIDLGGLGKFTVVSLRALLEPRIAPIDDDAFAAAWLEEDEEQNVIEGLRRAVLTHMGLRDQPILDRHQDEIFRLPIDTRCFLAGPPGTGKTTTLIRRLGQKIDIEDPEVLEPRERVLVDRARQDTGIDHRQNWIMFSPTELLRQYVKEAFALEGLAASDNHIHTWEQYRRAIARDYLGLLRTGTGGGAFVERPNDAHLDLEDTTLAASGWYDDFDDFLTDEIRADFAAGADWLAGSEDASLAALGAQIRDLVGRHGPRLRETIAPAIMALTPAIRQSLDEKQAEAGRIFNRTLNRLVRSDAQFPSALKREVERQLSLYEFQRDEPDDADADTLDDDEADAPLVRTVTREQARSRYQRAVTALARARARRRAVPAGGLNGRLLKWLGDERVPEGPDLDALARIDAAQVRLRRFANVERLLIRSVGQKYRKFRAERAKVGRWYRAAPERSGDLSWQELDVLVLATLRLGDQILGGYRRTPGAALPASGVLEEIRKLYRTQVLVDEATDFSVIQLACMYELSHPALRSFFVCGDFNQRLTTWGVRSNDELNWIAPNIERHNITVSYRQTGKLVKLASDVAALGGSRPEELVLPDRLDVEGVAPVWQANLGDEEAVADWLAPRIREIEATVGKVPTIAVFVNDEAEVEPLAAALDLRLQDVNLSAAACKDGQVKGNEHDVRVFNIKHIKGLEFEAVFFVGLDKTIAVSPQLYTKFLYVGATRAATYLGITFFGPIPEAVESLAMHFAEDWSV